MPDARTEAGHADPPNPGSITPPDLNMASPAELARTIVGDDTAQPFGLVHIGEPLPDFLTRIDSDRIRYEDRRPHSGVATLGLPQFDYWQAADAQLTAAYDSAHDAPSAIQVAARNDELAALSSVRNATKLAAPTRPVAEARAITDARLYAASLTMAEEAIGALVDALRHHWRTSPWRNQVIANIADALRHHWRTSPWRNQVIANIADAQADALAVRDKFTQSLARLHASRVALLAMDHDYGTCAPGATVMADLADPMVRLAPPAWHGLDVAQVLRGQTGSLNRPALNMGDLGTSEKFILARLVNEHVVVDGAA